MNASTAWAAIRRLDVFALIEKALTLAALVLVAITVGGELGKILNLTGTLGTVVAWSIAIVYDALWIGALRMSERAIRQRSAAGMAVMLGLTAVAVGVSTVTLFVLGHAEVFAFVPVAAAAFMGLRLFANNVLADPATSTSIAKQSAADRNARALAAAEARHLQSQATTDVVTETASHLAEMQRQIARADVLTKAQAEINEARAKAEKRLAKSEKEHGAAAVAFTERKLVAVASRPAVTPGRVTGVTQAKAEIATVTAPTVTADETDATQTLVADAMTLDDLATVDGVDLPQPGVTLTDEQLEVVLRWLRYGMEPPRSYRQAQHAFRAAGFIGGEHRVRRIWGEIETREAPAHR